MSQLAVDDIKSLLNSKVKILDEYSQTRLISKINEHFTNEEQQLYIKSFLVYTNYDKNSLCIELEDIRPLMGFTRKDNAKVILLRKKNGFKEWKKDDTEGVDFKIELAPAIAEASSGENKAASPIGEAASAIAGASLEHGGQNKEKIYLTPTAFKRLCLLANTEKAKKIHNYYIKLEEMLHEMMIEEAVEMKKQLQLKDNIIKEKEDKIFEIIKEKEDVIFGITSNIKFRNQQNLLMKHNKKRCLYLIQVTKTIIKFGITEDIVTRFATHQKEIGPDIVLIYVLETVYNNVIESKIKQLSFEKNDILFNKKISKIFIDKNQTELIQLDSNFTDEALWNKILLIEKTLNKDEIFIKLENDLLNEQNKIQILENKLKEKDKKIIQLGKLHVHDTIDFPVVATHIETNKKIEFDSLTKIQYHWKTSITTLRHYIDKHKQFNGYILRSGHNKPYWSLPANFKSSTTIKPTTQNIFIKRVDKITKEAVYYNSITEASIYLQHEIDCKEIIGETEDTILIKKALGEFLRGVPTKKMLINKYNWYKMKDIGLITNLDATTTDIEEYELKEKELKGLEVKGVEVKEVKDLKTEKLTNEELTNEELIQKKIPITVRNIQTNEEITYPEGYTHEKFDKYGIRKSALIDKYLNKQINFKNLTFRTLERPYWSPPSGLFINEEIDSARLKYFVKVEHKTLDIITTNYYNSLSDLSDHLFPLNNKRQISSAIKKILNKSSDSVKNTTHEISLLLKPYKFSKIQSCGSLVYNNGAVVNIEKNFMIIDLKI